ncbi:Glycosyl hydrolase family 35 protein [Prunus dulcis]|uniref:Glycosyl hydrolase family 35 protein n=1 Tax=Prunus dulcis TaxID=3755 RepID=A0A4Y1QTH0_PRUDU|nr:Glycosyl hydrolase family 35 protein [Prunus dulcis]
MDFVFNHTGDGPKRIAISRKLKENGYTPRTQKKGNVRNVNLDDYHPIDPSPSSKASIKPGPIEHGTPIIPYIPKPLPPAQPSPGATP